MASYLTKEQVASLAPEEQEVFARVALDEARFRRELRDKACGYRGRWALPAILWIAATCLWFWKPDLSIFLPVAGLMALGLFQFHVAGINSRIDALIRLIELDRTDC
ncbi:hypothetical protein [Luteolibacter marinus]|uniref:hypothetical protein n=1 Tax=Luteolibacter marinus TaxID=2776705 RepID=UPI001865B55E|nr:hypothetical protein [Luteolibacter marinus]